LGRAIVRNPKAFMMDEPLGALDAEFREHMSIELRALHDRMKATTVYVTHDQLEAMQMGDKIVVMNHGVIEQFGKPQDIYDKPASMFVAEFIGSPSMNFLRFHGSVEAGARAIRLHNQKFAIPQMRMPFEGDLAFGVRPEHIRLADSGGYRGEVMATEYLGTTQIVTIKTAQGMIKARLAARDRARVGETIGLQFDAKTITMFDNQTGRALRSELNEGVLAHG
jgi:multiple sugar transport system ATP-binding protein